VGVDYRGDRLVAPVLAHQGQGRGGGLAGDQRVDDDIARVALDEGDVRQVEITNLIDAGDHLEQAVDRVQTRLAP